MLSAIFLLFQLWYNHLIISSKEIGIAYWHSLLGETLKNILSNKMKEKVSKLTYPTLQHCLRMLHNMLTTIKKGGIRQSGNKP